MSTYLPGAAIAGKSLAEEFMDAECGLVRECEDFAGCTYMQSFYTLAAFSSVNSIRCPPPKTGETPEKASSGGVGIGKKMKPQMKQEIMPVHFFPIFCFSYTFSSVQLLSRVRLFVTP